MTAAEKLRLAQQLDRLGVDIIEAGFPISSDGDFEAVRTIAGAVRRPIIAGLARAIPADIDRAWAALSQAARPRIHVFLATSDIHLEHKLRISRAAVPGAGRDGGRARARLLRRRGVLGGGCDAQRPGLPLRDRRSGGERRRDDDQPARHCRLRAADRYRAHVHHRGQAHRRRAPSCRRIATTISDWRSRTRWPPCRRARARSSAPSTASASAPATRRSKRS